jgi:hypothetical protein
MSYFIRNSDIVFFNDLQLASGRADGLIMLTDEQIERHKTGLYEYIDDEQVLIQKTYAQELAELNAEYIAKVDALAEKITKAKAWDGASETSKVTALRAQKTEIDTKYISDLTLINQKWSN